MSLNAIAMEERTMAHGRRKSVQQQDLFITAVDRPRSDGHVFYAKLNRLLEEAEFDTWIENLCVPYYSQVRGRPRIPPGVYFRMLLVGNFRGSIPNAGTLGDVLTTSMA